MDEVLRYDEQELSRVLASMTVWQRTVVSAACAERLTPAYPRYVASEGEGNPTIVWEALSALWSALEGAVMSAENAIKHAAACEEAGPGEDDWNDWADYAENAAAAAYFAWRSWISGEVQFAEWALRQGYDAAYSAAYEGFEVDNEEVEQSVLRSAVVQRELRAQHSDIETILSADDCSRQASRLLRKRARATPFERPGGEGGGDDR